MSLWNWYILQITLNAEIVSILVLVDVALERGATDVCRRDLCEFQSLFSWMSLWNDDDGEGDHSWDYVSILVLVDVALEHVVI